jgi:hypothetical protein
LLEQVEKRNPFAKECLLSAMANIDVKRLLDKRLLNQEDDGGGPAGTLPPIVTEL